ncbi:hypothetical protein PoB_002720900 [Plakobranchus ocellatus]|uniref:Uncharacterized protein n=1 Tax=Plakobranchus ocellatus TaxID=259542 RepID=A0AAV4A3D2_9GAST|nr:hypothetical protein PoB_002720900 [Plakobranchus ocellatus]
MIISLAGSSVEPRYMDITEDGGLVCSTENNKIARVQVDTGTVAFNKSVPQIKNPLGAAITTDGSILVTDMSNKTLHLVSSQGVWIRQLWPTSSSELEDKIHGCDNNADIARFRILAMVSYFLRLLLGKKEDIIIETNEAYLVKFFFETILDLGAHQGSIFHITYYISALTNPEIWTVLKGPAKRNVSKLPAIQSYAGKSAVVIVQCADVLAASHPEETNNLISLP